MKNIKGFTLIELLVTVTIILVLSTIGLVVFSRIQENNRDQQRKKDLNTVAQSLELYRFENQSYPQTLSFALPLTGLFSADGRKKYLESLPTDPSYSPDDPDRHYNYCYLSKGCSDGKCGNYELYADLENPERSTPVCDEITYSSCNAHCYNYQMLPL